MKDLSNEYEHNNTEDIESTYKQGFFELFGTGNNLGFDEEPKDLPLKEDNQNI